jgi:hypothetical protein
LHTGVEIEPVMKKLAVVLVLAAACHSAGGPTAGTVRPAGSPISGGGVGGAISPRTAVTGFLAAARAEDLQALASMWGTSEGPARNSIPRDELEKREIVMICFLKHDRYRLLTDAESTSDRTRSLVRAGVRHGGAARRLCKEVGRDEGRDVADPSFTPRPSSLFS